MDAIAKRITENPLRSVGLALLAGAWLGYESPRRGIVLGLVRLLVMNELRTVVDALPAKYGDILRNPLAAAAGAATGSHGYQAPATARVIPS